MEMLTSSKEAVAGGGALLDLMGDTMAERLVGEIHTLLDSAVGGEGGKLKVFDLRGEEEKESPALEVQQYRKAEKEKILKDFSVADLRYANATIPIAF